jgi:cytochrome c5
MKLRSSVMCWFSLSCTLILGGCGETASPQVQQETLSAAPIAPGVLAKWLRSCALCHVDGTGGAPQIGSRDDWAPRLTQGEGLLMTHTVQGYNAMPPLGYCMSCERADLLAMIRYMSEAGE